MIMKKVISITLKILLIAILTASLIYNVIVTFNRDGKPCCPLSELSADNIAKILNSDDGSDSFRTNYLSHASRMTELVTVDDLDLPDDLISESRMEPFGMRIFDGEKYVAYYSGNNKALFDENKKTIFFAHGMGYNGSFRNPDLFYDDYNILCFYWGAFASEPNMNMPALAEKIYFYNGNLRYLNSDLSGWSDGKTLKYSVAEMYGAYYYDILSSHPNYAKEIMISGHSYGGMLTYGLLNYLITAFRCGLIGVSVLPDSVALFDPFLIAGKENLKIRWLGDMKNPVEHGGVVAIARQTMIDARIIGIAISLIRTSFFIEYPTVAALAHESSDVNDRTYIDEFNSHTNFILGYATDMLGLGDGHDYARIWPTLFRTELFDSVYRNEYSFSLTNPYHSRFARVGSVYTLDYNDTPYVTEDDIITIKDTSVSKLYGFVYDDINENGICDDGLRSHIYGATVTITDSDGKQIYNEKTSLNGYFEINDIPKGKYKISVKASDGSVKDRTVNVAENAHFTEASVSLNQ